MAEYKKRLKVSILCKIEPQVFIPNGNCKGWWPIARKNKHGIWVQGGVVLNKEIKRQG